MTDLTTDDSRWLGAQEVTEDDLSLAAATAAAAMLDESGTLALHPGAPLPPLWHWFYFLPKAAQASLGHDGHPQRGGFMPPIALPRRMFAGARLRFLQPLRIGQSARRVAEIRAIEHKSGRTGNLAFVSVLNRFYQGDQLCIEEEQDIVYREPGAALAAPVPLDAWPALPTDAWSRIVTPDTRLLFRFSALTFNAHRIHYDRPYAMQEEGYPGLVVHGPLTAVLLMGLLRQHTAAPVKSFQFRGLAPLFDLASFRLVGRTDGHQVTLQAQAPDGKPAMSASAELSL